MSSSNMRNLQRESENKASDLTKLQKESAKNHQMRKKYTDQLGENELVLKELDFVKKEANVYKLTGPVLDNQDLAEANAKFLSKFKEREVMVKTEAPDQAPHEVYLLPSLRILAVDKDAANLKFILKTYEAKGHLVLTCSSTTTALSLLQEAESFFHIVFVEHHMPIMDGLEFLKWANKETNLPIIIMSSAHSDWRSMVEARRCGASEYMIKPLSTNLLETIRWHIFKKQSTLIKQLTLIKKPKMKWTEEIETEFLKAVDQIGFQAARPKEVHELMNQTIPGLSRKSVAYHLRKHRKKVNAESTDHEEMQQQQPEMREEINGGSAMKF